MHITIILTIIGMALLRIGGLSIFEIVNSLDNAVVNANVLRDIKNKAARRFFVTFGIIIAVFVVRGVIPFIIYYIPNYKLGLGRAIAGFWNGDPEVAKSVAESAPLLLIGGGLFLVLLFLKWFLSEEKEREACAFGYEYSIQKYGEFWFNAAACSLLVFIMFFVYSNITPVVHAMGLMISSGIGLAMFFICDGFKANAERKVESLTSESNQLMSDWSKVLFLEVIDATFSIDGVVGAFAFTMYVPYILIGNGIGAYVVRRLTLGNIDKLCSYPYLKNGTMYSVGIVGLFMVLESLGIDLPFWVSPVSTFILVGLFFWMSVNALNKKEVEVA